MARIAQGAFAVSRGRLTLVSWAALLALPCFLMTALGRDEERTAKAPQGEIAQTFTERERAEMRKAVEAVLPPQWFVFKTKTDSTPPDWWCDDPRGGFLVECSNGSEVCRVWFLPLDWIGIRKVPNKAAQTCYWEGVLGQWEYKTITHCDNDKLQAAMQKLFGGGMSTPSLINSGYGRAEQIFAHRTEEADAVAQRLIKEHCTTPKEFAEAAHSLVVLGVPARNVYLRAAREVEGMDKDFFTGALGLLGGDDAIGVLCDVLSDSKAGDHARSYAAMALREYTDKRIGPALHKALKEMSPGGEAMSVVIRELGRTHYEPALPDLLGLLHDPEKKSQGPASQALATLRCKDAIPDLRKLVEQYPRKKDEPPAAEGCEMALLRLEGDWGRPGNEARFMLWLPPETTVGLPIQATVYEENIASGYREFSAMAVTKDDFMANGKPLIEPDPNGRASRAIGGSFISFSAPPGYVGHSSVDLSKYITKPGRYKIRYGLGDVHSNEAVIVVHEAPPK